VNECVFLQETLIDNLMPSYCFAGELQNKDQQVIIGRIVLFKEGSGAKLL